MNWAILINSQEHMTFSHYLMSILALLCSCKHNFWEESKRNYPIPQLRMTTASIKNYWVLELNSSKIDVNINFLWHWLIGKFAWIGSTLLLNPLWTLTKYALLPNIAWEFAHISKKTPFSNYWNPINRKMKLVNWNKTWPR